MNDEMMIITSVSAPFIANDHAGRKVKYERRAMSGFIITISGCIRFSFEGGELIARPGTAIFLPRGLCYVNECIEDAKSYVFNLHTLSDHPPKEIECPSAPTYAERCYDAVLSESFSQSHRNNYRIMEQLYGLIYSLSDTGADSLHPIVDKALTYMHRESSRADLTADDIARHCNVSEIYLRKLFGKILHTTPFKALTDIRMNRARMLICEKRPVKEVAHTVGYADLYQFSRAYKRYFGYPPSETL